EPLLAVPREPEPLLGLGSVSLRDRHRARWPHGRFSSAPTTSRLEQPAAAALRARSDGSRGRITHARGHSRRNSPGHPCFENSRSYQHFRLDRSDPLAVPDRPRCFGRDLPPLGFVVVCGGDFSVSLVTCPL